MKNVFGFARIRISRSSKVMRRTSVTPSSFSRSQNFLPRWNAGVPYDVPSTARGKVVARRRTSFQVIRTPRAGEAAGGTAGEPPALRRRFVPLLARQRLDCIEFLFRKIGVDSRELLCAPGVEVLHDVRQLAR